MDYPALIHLKMDLNWPESLFLIALLVFTAFVMWIKRSK